MGNICPELATIMNGVLEAAGLHDGVYVQGAVDVGVGVWLAGTCS